MGFLEAVLGDPGREVVYVKTGEAEVVEPCCDVSQVFRAEVAEAFRALGSVERRERRRCVQR